MFTYFISAVKWPRYDHNKPATSLTTGLFQVCHSLANYLPINTTRSFDFFIKASASS